MSICQTDPFAEIDDEKEAVARAAREFLRVVKMRELKAASGKVDYVGVGQEMEALEGTASSQSP